MRRLSFAIIVVVLLFVGGVAGILVVRGRAVRADRPEAPPSSADYRIKEVRLQERGSGDVEWQLDAAVAEVFEQQGKTAMRDVTITIVEPDRTWTVTGDEGELFEASKDVVLRKNVVLVASDGFRLETESLHWLAKDRRVWTKDPVTIFRNDAVIRGEGLEALMGEERTAVRGRIRATFFSSKSPKATRSSAVRTVQ